MSEIDLSPEALQHRKFVAEIMADQGDKFMQRVAEAKSKCGLPEFIEFEDEFLSSNTPSAVIAMIDEIEHLRKENATLAFANSLLLAKKAGCEVKNV